MDQIFLLQILVKNMLMKCKKVYAAFMDLNKTYDGID